MPQLMFEPGRLLKQAADALSGNGAAVLTVNSDGRFAPLLTYRAHGDWANGDWCADDLPQAAAERALKASDPAHGAVLAEGGGLQASCFAVPLEVDADLLGVLVVTGLGARAPSAASCANRLGPLIEAIALMADRQCLLAELDKREQEVSALARQLQVYAADFRSTYTRERARSRQAAKALSDAQQNSLETLEALAGAVEARDRCSTGHVQRATQYAKMLTGLVGPQYAKDRQLEYGFLLHDIGKLNLPEKLLAKTGPLSHSERAQMQQHPVLGLAVLEKLEFLDGARAIVHSHHERWDGHGYPEGLHGTEIPFGARVFALCDAFDAMTSDRPYRSALSTGEALEQLRAGAGAQFWPEGAEAFLSLPRDELEVVRSLGKEGEAQRNELGR